MKEIRFGVIYSSNQSCVAVSKKGGEVNIEFVNGANFISEKELLPTIAKEIERFKRTGSDFGIYSGFHGIFVSDEEIPWATEIFRSSCVNIDNINMLVIVSNDGVMKEIKRVRPTLWKSDESTIHYYNDKHIIRYLFEILLSEYQKESDNFNILRNDDVIKITLGGETA